MTTCSHPTVCLARTNAVTSKPSSNSGQADDQISDSASCYPAPLCLPGDDLTLEPEFRQSLLSWVRDKNRNRVTSERKTIYIAHAPSISESIGFIRDWSIPNVKIQGDRPQLKLDSTAIAHYISAFYNGLPVKMLPQSTYIFSPWEDTSRCRKLLETSEPSFGDQYLLGLDTHDQRIGVRTRSRPHDVFTHQLNLNDLIDVVIETLPDDAYAMLLLIDHDLYEDEDDVFVCGRAYGGSRAAVVSTARYNPLLDSAIRLDTTHLWPQSHCTRYISSLLLHEGHGNVYDADSASYKIVDHPSLPMCAAIKAANEHQETQVETMSDLWLGRICRTVSHELGHCFGIEHCVFYACCMQGSASLHEDHRQPPYLCPIDLAKVLRATASTESARELALLSFCKQYETVALFAAYEAWLLAKRAA